jgi:hypothetical protein
MSSFEQRREELAAKRQTQLAIKAAERLAIEAPRTQEPSGGQAAGAVEEASSEEDDDDIIERVVVKNDPNTGKHESKAIRDRFEAAKKIRDEARAKVKAESAKSTKPARPTTRPKIEDMDLQDLDDINKYHNQTLESDSDED